MRGKTNSDPLTPELALVRTPVFALDADLATHWDELKQYISHTSPDLFELIHDAGYTEYLLLPERIRLPVWKYFNRAKYRPTPFGSFASVTFTGQPAVDKPGHTGGPQAEDNPLFSLTLEKKQFLHEYMDWEILYGKREDAASLFRQAGFLWTNSTLYRHADTWRCLTRDSAVFTLIGIDYQGSLDDILQYCREPVPQSRVFGYLEQHYGLTLADAEAFLIGLVEMQVLLTDMQPNITGEDYFSRIADARWQHGDSVGKYTISERALLEIKGQLDTARLREVIPLLQQALPDHDPPGLVDFRRRFLQRFEYRNIPLMLALDPELGVGYGDMEDQDDQLPVAFPAPADDADGSKLPPAVFSPLYRYILDAVLEGKEPVRLEGFDRSLLRDTGRKMPNSIHAIIRPLEGGLGQLEFAGGCTGNSMIGRFSLALPALQEYGRKIAREESQANPDVLFADVAYIGDKKADNISRRAQLYDYELPILTWSTGEHAQPLRLNDLYVCVQGDEVILTSKSLGKRVIPRIVSAYNYQRTELALFRFFVDLQYQGLQSGLSLSLQNVLPGLSRYPRVVYRDLILSPSRWKVPAAFCRIAPGDMDTGMQKFSDWLEQSGIDAWIRYGFADQFLYFDLRNPQDRRYLLLSLQGGSRGYDPYLEEFLMPSGSAVSDPEGSAYAVEQLLVVLHRQKVYEPVQPDLSFHFDPDQKTRGSLYMPGDQWIYAEVYLHPSRSNPFLHGMIHPLVKRWSGRLSGWFFVRYNHPAFHLRLRFKCRKKEDTGILFAEINQELHNFMLDGTLRDIQWKPYVPESERYGAENLPRIEQCFSHSSRMVLSLLDKHADTAMLYRSVARLFDAVFDRLDWPVSRRLAYTEAVAENFVQEFRLDQASFKSINKTAKEWSLDYRQDKTHFPFLSHTARSFSETLLLYPDWQQPQILADLFHMHINRLFQSSPRRHECLIYQYMRTVLKITVHNPG